MGKNGFDLLLEGMSLKSSWSLFMGHVRKSRDKAGPLEMSLANRLMEWAERYLGEQFKEILAESYVSFVTNVNKEQLSYEKKGTYRHNSFDDVFRCVYGNEDFMRKYHWGADHLSVL